MNYKCSIDFPQNQHLFDSLALSQLFVDENGHPSFSFNDLIGQINSIYNHDENAFFIPDRDFLEDILNRTIFALQNFKSFTTDLCFFHFFIFLLSAFHSEDQKEDNSIKEKALVCSSYLVNLDYFAFNELSEQLLLSTFQFIQKTPIAMIPSINAIKCNNFSQVFISSNIADEIIKIINQKKFDHCHFYFLSKYLKYFKKHIIANNHQIIDKSLQISYEFSDQKFGLYLLSKIVKNYGMNSIEINEIIIKHLMLKNNENAKSLFRILYYYSLNLNLEIEILNLFKFPNFFELFFEYFEICDENMQLKQLVIVYMLVPYYPNELLPFIYHLLDISITCSYSIFTKISDIVILYSQEIDENQVSANFINNRVFEIFEQLLANDNSKVFFSVVEILMVLKDINKKLFVDTIANSEIREILESMIENENEYIQEVSTTAIKHLFYDEEDDDD